MAKDDEPVAVVDDGEEEEDDEDFEDPVAHKNGASANPVELDDERDDDEDDDEDEEYDSEDDEDAYPDVDSQDDGEDDDEDDDEEDGPAAAAGQRPNHADVLKEFYLGDQKDEEEEQDDSEDYVPGAELGDAAEGAKRKASGEDGGGEAKKAKAA